MKIKTIFPNLIILIKTKILIKNGLKEDAERYLRKALLLDLRDIMGNTGKEGLHLACMGEAWQAMQILNWIILILINNAGDGGSRSCVVYLFAYKCTHYFWWSEGKQCVSRWDTCPEIFLRCKKLLYASSYCHTPVSRYRSAFSWALSTICWSKPMSCRRLIAFRVVAFPSRIT